MPLPEPTYAEGTAGAHGLPDHDFYSAGVVTTAFAATELEFRDQTNPGSGVLFLSQGMIFANDGGSDIEFSWDGVAINGVVKPGEVLTFDNRHKQRVWIRGTSGGEAYRFWAW